MFSLSTTVKQTKSLQRNPDISVYVICKNTWVWIRLKNTWSKKAWAYFWSKKGALLKDEINTEIKTELSIMALVTKNVYIISGAEFCLSVILPFIALAEAECWNLMYSPKGSLAKTRTTHSHFHAHFPFPFPFHRVPNENYNFFIHQRLIPLYDWAKAGNKVASWWYNSLSTK